MNKYQTLVNILDELRNEAPKVNKRYYPSENDNDKLNKARARAYIHLFLKVKFGLTEFNKRELLITDDPYDAGIDAYYIDKDTFTIYFLQSKFRTTESNYEQKKIDLSEILCMDVDRVTDGEKYDEDGNRYNKKILNMIDEIAGISDIGRYKYKVIILANIGKYKDSQIKKLTSGLAFQIYNHERCYEELVFPVVSGTFFTPEEILITLTMNNSDSKNEVISYNVVTECQECAITVVFVPLIEIAKILRKYKNSILKFNPRCFLSLKNNINDKIADTVTQKKTNEFALFNNGITMLSDNTKINTKVGKKGLAQLIIENPQVINGGQTAFTLTELLNECIENSDYTMFEDKEVLLKVITFTSDEDLEGECFLVKKLTDDEIRNRLDLVEAISKATNQQTVVKEADRRANDKVQIEFQKYIYQDFGYFYMRKKGEYHEGLSKRYIENKKVIDRNIMIRIAFSCNNEPSKARRNGEEVLFREENFNKVFYNTDLYKKYMYGYFAYERLVEIDKKYNNRSSDKHAMDLFGNALRYGKYAVVTAVIQSYNEKENIEKYRESARKNVEDVLDKWIKFESEITSLSNNVDYFYTRVENGVINKYYNYDGYYKGRTINGDILKYSFIERS